MLYIGSLDAARCDLLSQLLPWGISALALESTYKNITSDPFNSGHGTLRRCQCLGTCTTATESVANRRWGKTEFSQCFFRSLIDVKQGETDHVGTQNWFWLYILHSEATCGNGTFALAIPESNSKILGHAKTPYEFEHSTQIVKVPPMIRICERQIQPLLGS